MLAELIDKCVGSRIWIVMKGDKGTAPAFRMGKVVRGTSIYPISVISLLYQSLDVLYLLLLTRKPVDTD